MAQHQAERYRHADRVRFGKEGAAAKREAYRRSLFEKLAHLGRDEAIWKAWKMGRHANKTYRLRYGAEPRGK